MSAKLTPEEIAAFCDAVDLLRKYHDNTAFGEEWHQMAAANKRVKENLPKLRAMAEPAAVPVSELEALLESREWRYLDHRYLIGNLIADHGGK